MNEQCKMGREMDTHQLTVTMMVEAVLNIVQEQTSLEEADQVLCGDSRRMIWESKRAFDAQ